MSKKLINLSNLQKFLLKLNEKFALKKAMKGISEDSEGNIIIGEEGLVPTPDENSKGKFLRSDGTWSVPGDSPLYESMTQEEGIEGVSEVDRVINAKTLKAVIEENENVVHTSGNEDVSGVKTFTDNMYIKRDGPRFRLQDTRGTKGTKPESSIYNQALYICDANQIAYGGLHHSYLDDSRNQISMISFSGTTNDNEDYAKITVGYDGNGKWFTYAPTPAETDNSTKIATTEFVSKKDGNVVHKSGNETITGLKTFERNGNFINTKNTNVYLGCNPTSNQHQWINFLDKNDEQTGFISNCHYPGGSNVIELYAQGKYKDGKPDPAGEKVSAMFRVGLNSAGEKYMYTTASWGCDFIPRVDNTYTLGSSSFKWKSIYGNLVGNADTATQFSANKSVTLTGDVTGTASSKGGWSVATTLANSGVTAGSYGPTANVTGNNNATISVPQITVDAKGRVTSVVNRTLTCKNNTYTVPTKVSQLTNDSKFVSLNALGSGVESGMQETAEGSIMLCVCNCQVFESANVSIQSKRNLHVPGSYLRPISWVETSLGLERTAPTGSSYALPGTWRLLGNSQSSSTSGKIYYVGLFMRVV